jgi:hypothetical protein
MATGVVPLNDVAGLLQQRLRGDGVDLGSGA